ncbi:DEAD/DEAH box helicase family protein [Kocuria flava]|uniref:restriction endonuclease n=1 Tax=Kocuria flava TaxID=446860 RepID=UPI003F199961
MKFRFEDQPHQAAAVNAVTDLFEGALLPPVQRRLGEAPGAEGHKAFLLDLIRLGDNLHAVTEREHVDVQSELAQLSTTDLRGADREFPNFTVEMETGTGKTYVYISTALQMARDYGVRKFVILVHSIAIRAGVVKTFEQTQEHFASKYPDIKYHWGVLGEGPALDDFTEPSSTVQFMVVSVQAIDKPESNAIYQEAEQPQLWGEAMNGIASVAKMRPVVLIDEPQNMATDLRRQAIATLNPMVALRYSATHKETFNLVHQLGPKAAADAGLVKRVSVKGIVAGSAGRPYLLFNKLRSKNKRLMAEVVMDCDTAGGPKRQDVVLQNGMDLYEESEGLDQYRGMVVDRFERKPDRIVFENGLIVHKGEEIGVDRESVWKDQVRHTIRQHLKKQQALDGTDRDVKVLSLFFVEHVSDYVGAEAPLPQMFDALFREEWERAGNSRNSCPDPSSVRVHYFPSTKTGIYKDTKGNATDSEFEERAYQEIIANKELLLTRENPRAFIFSHSALKEGWDNPNVFQVGFLRHTRSELERRQQIGRGLRLPVDTVGRRVLDNAQNKLTLIVDEAFSDFRDGLNREYIASGGSSATQADVENADHEVVVTRRNDLFTSEEFKELWKRIRYKARYRVTLDPSILPLSIAQSESLDEIDYLTQRGNVLQTAELRYDDKGFVVTADVDVNEDRGTSLSIKGQRLPDPVRLVEDQLLTTKFPLQLTRPTIMAILAALPLQKKRKAIHDPERWSRIVAKAIRQTTIEQMVEHITYEALPDEKSWDAEVVFVEAESITPPPPSPGVDPSYGVAAARDGGSNLYDATIYDSHVERSFAEQLENDDRVVLFTKLPRRFKVGTPVGEYSPDWAIVYDDDGNHRLYLVRESKDTTHLEDLDWSEQMRIRFAGNHFAAAPNGLVEYAHTDARSGLRIDDAGSGKSSTQSQRSNDEV